MIDDGSSEIETIQGDRTLFHLVRKVVVPKTEGIFPGKVSDAKHTYPDF